MILVTGSEPPRRPSSGVKLVSGTYERAQERSLDRGDVLTTPHLPGLELPLADVFAD